MYSPSSQAEATGVLQLYYQVSRTKMTDSHLWLSTFFRPTRSTFTRAQRLTCGYVMLYLTMIVNAMFYHTDEKVDRPEVVQIGPFRFSTHQMFVSVISVLLVLPVAIIITQLFRISSNMLDKQRKKTLLNWNRKIKHEQEIDEEESIGSDYAWHKRKDAIESHSKPLVNPRYLLLTGWILGILTILASAFFVILYSMEWGKAKSEEWLTSFLMSFIETILFFDPLLVSISYY